MKSLQPVVAFLFFLSLSMNGQAQHVKLVEGAFDVLNNEKKINIEFTYDSMKVGKYDKEQDFIAHKTADLNKSEPGKGDTWAKKWVEDRGYKFEEKFNEEFKKYSDKEGGPQKDAKYTIIFHTTFTEPGFSAGWPVRKNAEIRGEAIIVETANRNNVIGKITVEKAMGGPYGGFDFDTGVRIADAYGEAGKALGKFIK